MNATLAAPSQGPLAGLKVVEIGLAMAGPFAAMTLADYGAEVIKIERPGAGDDSRHWPPYFHDRLGYYFVSANRSKRSIAVDMKSPGGVVVIKDLVKEADIVIDNFRHGVLDRLGLGYEALREINPRLIYCDISGFGATGPRRDDAANDLFMQAFSGGMSITGEVGRAPAKMAISVADIGAAMYGTIGILMALEARHRTGKGQKIETSLLEGQIAMLSYHFTSYFTTGVVPGPTGSGTGISVPYQAFQSADNWLVIAVFNERMWADFCKAVERVEWTDDARFCSTNQRVAHRDILIPMIEEVIIQKPAGDWEAIFAAHGVPSTRVNTIEQIANHEQVAARDMIQEMDVPGIGKVKLPGLPMKFSETPAKSDMPPPGLGAHSREVLAQPGYDEARIAGLFASGAVVGEEQK